MKNLSSLLIFTGIVSIALFMPAEQTKAFGHGDGGLTPLFLECYHSRDGVLDSTPYTVLQNTNTCPPCDSVAACANSPTHNKSLPGVPPYLCQEVGIREH